MSPLDAALSAGDLTVMREVPHQARYYLSVAPLVTVATAQIDDTVFPVPLAQLTVDNTSAGWSNVQRGMMALIGTTPGAADIGVYRVRKTPTSTILYLAETASGDPGLIATRQTKHFQDNAYITIKAQRNVWSVFPRIEYTPGGDGAFYKDYDVPYSNQNAIGGAVPAIVNIGENVAVKIPDSTTHTDSRSASVLVFDGTVTDYLWTKDAAGTVVSGSLTGSSVGIQYPPGNYLISLTVTLSGGAIVTVTREVRIHDRSTNPPVEVIVNNQNINRQGASFTAEIVGAFPDDLLLGAMVILFEETLSDTIASATTKAIGFVESVDGRTKSGLGVATITVISPLRLMEKIRAFSQLLRAVSSPTKWTEASAALMSLDFFVFYILYWHTTLLELFDFTPSGSTAGKYIWKADGGSFVQAVNSAAELIDAELTQDSHGNLYLKHDPVMLDSAARAAVVERFPCQKNDIVDGSLGYQRNIRAVYGLVKCLLFSAETGNYEDIAAYAALGMGGAGGQGTQEMTFTRLGDGLEDAKQLAGMMFAKLNNSIPRLGIDLMTGYALIEPALRYFLPLDVTDANLLPTNETLNFRIVPDEVNITYDKGISRRISVTGTAETIGVSGVETAVGARDDYAFNIPDLGLDGLVDLPFDLFAPVELLGLPPFDDMIISESTVPGEPGEEPYAESTELICWGSKNPSSGTLWYTADYTAGLSTVWSENSAEASSTIYQCLPDGDSRAAVYALYGDRLRYTSNVATIAASDVVTGMTGARLMRQMANGNIVIFGNDGTNNYVRIWSGTLGSAIIVAASATSEMAGDVDDHGLGLIIMPANRQIYFYNGSSFVQMTGLTGVTGLSGAEITDVRIPYKRVSGALNNNLSAMEIYYSIRRTGLWRATVNFNTNTVISETGNICPILGGLNTGVFGAPDSASSAISYGHNFESYAGNANRLLGMFRNSAGNVGLFKSSDAGANWQQVSGAAGTEVSHMVHFVEPIRGGNGQKAWVLGTSNTYVTNDFWNTYSTISRPTMNNPNLPRGVFQL